MTAFELVTDVGHETQMTQISALMSHEALMFMFSYDKNTLNLVISMVATGYTLL